MILVAPPVISDFLKDLNREPVEVPRDLGDFHFDVGLNQQMVRVSLFSHPLGPFVEAPQQL